MEVKRIGDHDLPLPQRANPGDLGYDLRTTVAKTLQPMERFTFPTGFAYAFLQGQGARIEPRSGLANEYGVDVLAGTVDGGYRGEVKVILINLGQEPVSFAVGDRIAQMRIVELVNPAHFAGELQEVPEFVLQTQRGANGFGSSGRN